MKTIDNKGRGNCMYYAYAISLMYYLRAQKDDTVHKILRRLDLTPDHHQDILAILARSKNLNTPFSTHDNTTIQDILGSACRGLASRAVRKEFIAKPEDTAVYSAAAYQFFQHFSKTLPPRYSQYIERRSDILGNYGKAEIFKVPGMRHSMAEYAKRVSKEVEKEFNETGENIKKHLQPSEHIKEKRNLMEAIISKKTIQFFQIEQHTHLDRYIRHLNTDTTWGSEETLLSLNRTLSNEKAVYDPDTKQWTISSDTPINLAMAVNGEIVSGVSQTENDRPHIILDNRHLTHWVSIIPDSYLADISFSLKHLYQQFINFVSHQQNPIQTAEETAERTSKPHVETHQAVVSLEEAKLEKALIKIIRNPEVRASYHLKLLALFNKPSDIKNLAKAEAKKGESDESFAERLQAAEVRSFLRRK